VKAIPFDLLPFKTSSQNKVLNERLLLEYLNESGENIFENKTFDPNQVTLGKNGEYYSEVVDLYNDETKFLIWIDGYSEGKNVYSISLNPILSKIEILTVYTTLTDFNGCTGPKFAIDSVFYNDEKRTTKEISTGLKKLTVIY
jgi:hypothetical protein